MKVRSRKEILLILLVVTMLFSVPLRNIRPAMGLDTTLFVLPDRIEDETYTPGTTFPVEIYVDDVASMFGFEFVLAYNTTVLSATAFQNYDPFSDLSPSKINDTAGYVSVAASYPIPEYFGLTTEDPVPVARVDFIVDPNGYGYSALHLRTTVIVGVWGADPPIEHTAIDGRFVNLFVHDIAVIDVTVNRTQVLPGRKIAINATVYNDGTLDETFDVNAYYDSTQAAPTQTVTTLIPKTSRTLTFVWDTTGVSDGTYTIKANASLTGDVSPADNEKIDGTVIITSTVEHDIAVTSVVTNTTKVIASRFVQINVTVQNNGNIEETFDATVYYSNATADYLIETKTSIFLWDGTSTKITYNWNTTNVYWGNYTVKAKAPVTGDLIPADNELSDGIVGVGLQDIAVIAVSLLSPSYPVVTIGDIAQIEVRARNQGIQNATFTVTLYRNDTVIETQNVTDLRPTPPYPIKLLTFNWNTTIVYPGNYTIKAVASTLNGEVSIADNTHFLDLEPPIITVQGEYHDVTVTDITTPSTILSGNTIPVQVTVKNLGTKEETINATLYYDSTLIGTETDRTLPAPPNTLSTRILTFNWNTTGVPLGTYTLKANITVVANDVNSTNNMMTIEVTIVVHNIAITSFTANPTTAVLGQTVNLNITIQNQGNFSETFIVTLRYNDALIGNAFTVTVAAGATRSFPTPWRTPAGIAVGVYTLTANASAVEGETNIDDNVKTIQVTLKVGSSITLTADPLNITLGGNTTLSGSIDKKPVGAAVTIWYRVKGTTTWINLAGTTTGTDGSYSYTWTPATAGIYEVKSSWGGNATINGDESDQPYPTITVAEEGGAPPGGVDLTTFALAGVAVVIIIAIAAVYFLRIRKPK